MKAILEFQLSLIEAQMVPVSEGATFLDIQVQNGVPCLWVMCDPDFVRVNKMVRTYGTGQVLPDDPGEYVGTYQFDALVFHVFIEQEV